MIMGILQRQVKTSLKSSLSFWQIFVRQNISSADRMLNPKGRRDPFLEELIPILFSFFLPI